MLPFAGHTGPPGMLTELVSHARGLRHAGTSTIALLQVRAHRTRNSGVLSIRLPCRLADNLWPCLLHNKMACWCRRWARTLSLSRQRTRRSVCKQTPSARCKTSRPAPRCMARSRSHDSEAGCQPAGAWQGADTQIAGAQGGCKSLAASTADGDCHAPARTSACYHCVPSNEAKE